jgi:D-cysteine desulfhydrase
LLRGPPGAGSAYGSTGDADAPGPGTRRAGRRDPRLHHPFAFRARSAPCLTHSHRWRLSRFDRGRDGGAPREGRRTLIDTRLDRFPRRRYTSGATALEPLPRLTVRLGGPKLYIKRDDMLGLAGGGNKTRKLEFLVADALEREADTLVTAGAVQSNHCRLTLAAAVREGLRCRIVLEERVPNSYDPAGSGNNFLYGLLGVEAVRVVEAGADYSAAMADIVGELEAEGRVGYVVPSGGSTPLGALGYVACVQELLEQSRAMGLRVDHVVCASGSGGTHAGLLAGVLATDSRIDVTGISVRHPMLKQQDDVRNLANDTLRFLDLDRRLPDDAVRVSDEYVGPGYSLPTNAMIEAVRTLARLEGILLDPVYTGKAMSGLIDLCRQGYFRPGENVVFLHTGGVPSLFGYQSMFLA